MSSLPKGRKVALGFRDAAKNYLVKLEKEGGKDLLKKEQRLRLHLSPFFRDKPLSKTSTFDIERFKKSRKEEGVKNGTINRSGRRVNGSSTGGNKSGTYLFRTDNLPP